MTTAIVFIPLTQGKVAVIDFDDFEKVRGVSWCAHKIRRRFYAARRVTTAVSKSTLVHMHRTITACPPDMQVNHVNGDGLDNRRVNLQVCSSQQNAFAFQSKRKGASSSFRGVSWMTKNKCWQAQIHHNRKTVYIGSFDSEETAARAYDEKAIELFGEFATSNFLTNDTQQKEIKPL